MRRWVSWMAGGVLMIVMAGAVLFLITAGERLLMNVRPEHVSPPTTQSGRIPDPLAEQFLWTEKAYYLLGIQDAVQFWRLTGVVPDTPALRDALWDRHRASPSPLTAAEAKAMLQHVRQQSTP